MKMQLPTYVHAMFLIVLVDLSSFIPNMKLKRHYQFPTIIPPI